MAETVDKPKGSVIGKYRNASSKDVQKALARVTNEKKWEDPDCWRDYLHSRYAIFNKIAESSGFVDLDWSVSGSWELLEKEYIKQSKLVAKAKPQKGELPLWTLNGNWMDEYPEFVKWMRHQHCKNNKKKLESVKKRHALQQPERITSGDTTSGSAEAGNTSSGVNWQDVVLRSDQNMDDL